MEFHPSESTSLGCTMYRRVCVSVDVHPGTHTMAGLPPVPSGPLMLYPICILHSLIKTCLPRSLFLHLSPVPLCFLIYFSSSFSSTSSPLSNPYFSAYPPLLSIFCFMSCAFTLPLIAFFSLYFSPTHFPPVWDCCSEPPSPEPVIP